MFNPKGNLMSTQSASAAGSGARTVVTVVSTDTYVSSALTEPVTAKLPAGSEMSDGDAIVFECTGGSLMVIETEAGRHVGVVPGDGQAVVVYEPGDSGDDFWRFSVLAQSPTATIADEAAATAATATGTATGTLAALASSEILDVGGLAIATTLTSFKLANALVFRLGGVQVDKAAEDNIAFSAADTINTGTAAGQYWGIWAIQCSVAGVVSSKSPSADQVYANEAAAIAALPAADAGNVVVGYITVQTVADLAFTANTHEIDETTPTATVNFYDISITDLITTQIAAAKVDIDALVVDVAALIVDDAAMVTDFNSLRGKVNSILAVLEKRGFLKAE